MKLAIGVLAVHDRAPLDYRYALDAAMPLLSMDGTPLVRCHVPELDAEIDQRLPIRSDIDHASAGLWVEPLLDSWKDDLAVLARGLQPDGRLCVVASRPLARLLPERRAWPGKPLGSAPGGLRQLIRSLRRSGFTLQAQYGIHGLRAIGLNHLGQWSVALGRPDLGDRLQFAARLHYCTAGQWISLSTVAFLIMQRKSA